MDWPQFRWHSSRDLHPVARSNTACNLFFFFLRKDVDFFVWFFFQKRVFQFTKQQSNKATKNTSRAARRSLAFFSACPKLLKSWRCCLSLSFVANLLVSLSSPKVHRNSNDFTSCLLSFLPQSSPERTPKRKEKRDKDAKPSELRRTLGEGDQEVTTRTGSS